MPTEHQANSSAVSSPQEWRTNVISLWRFYALESLQEPYTSRFPLYTEPRPRHERCDEQIVMVLTLCAMVDHHIMRKNQVYFTLHILGLPEWLVPRYIFTTW